MRVKLWYEKNRSKKYKAKADRKSSLLHALMKALNDLGHNEYLNTIVKQWQEKHPRRESSLSQISRLSLPPPS